jgi:N,N'-diacetyllegionaminate synthase
MTTTPEIIAEAGVNHNGSVEMALALVDSAKGAGAHIVKFQTYLVDDLVTRTAPLAPYQTVGSQHDSQWDLLTQLSLERNDLLAIKRRCEKVGIEFLSTAFDVASLELLIDLGIHRIKIPSGEITNYPLLRRAAESGLPVLLSTGMSTFGDIEGALDVLDPNRRRRSDLIILHCTTAYPAPASEVNMSTLVEIRERFGYPVGYSDHTLGSIASIMAVASGAQVIEKHLTLDNNLDGPDHKASLEPSSFKKFVDDMELAWTMLGESSKTVTATESQNLVAARKSVYFRRDVIKGQVIVEADIVSRRPASGVSPMQWPQIIGSRASRDFVSGELFEW